MPARVPFWDPAKDNGGATSVGVTRDKIYLDWPCLCGFFETEQDTKDLLSYFNAHFTLYGRKVEFREQDLSAKVFVAPPYNPADMQADAAAAASGDDKNAGVSPHQTFASLSYMPRAGAERYFYDALASRHVISVNSDPTASTEARFDQFAPYEWSTTPGLDHDMRHLAEMICVSLKGRTPQWSGSQGVDTSKPRVFAVGFVKEGDGTLPDTSVLTNQLNACGAAPAFVEDASNPDQFILDAKNRNVSSITCICGAVDIGALMQSATKQAYLPEWLVSHYEFQNIDGVGSPPAGNTAPPPYPQEHLPHVFGLSFFNKTLPPDQTFWYSAIREITPTYTYRDNGADVTNWNRYEEMMLVFSGLQMAGPNLTPQSFQSGLFRAQFPNPNHGAAPYYQAGVAFGPGMHSFFNDAQPVWYDTKSPNYTTNETRTGSFCYVAGGIRFGLGQWPADVRFFGGQSCR